MWLLLLAGFGGVGLTLRRKRGRELFNWRASKL
ncbi:hypothetical protein [Polymorphobacter megasporae]|nr:hypothetical protein [Polymorphobacter megasporae]